MSSIKLHLQFTFWHHFAKKDIVLLQDGGLIEMDIPKRVGNCGCLGKKWEATEIEKELAVRKSKWRAPEMKGRRGVFGRYTRNALSAMQGAGLE